MKSSVFERVYEVVRAIPAGKVMTYGQVGKLVGTSGRVVGFALHANPYEDAMSRLYVPCHRVVNRDGKLAPHFAFGGEKEQFLRLKSEGVTFGDQSHVDLERNLLTYP